MQRGPVEPVDTAKAVQWRSGLLDITNEPLFAALDELGRYTDRKVLAEDARLKPLRVTVTLPVRDARKALTRLEQLAPILVKESQDAFTVTYRKPAS